MVLCKDMVNIRIFNKDLDYDQVKNCAIALQNFERQLDPRMPTGESIADEYMANMLEECKKYSGIILVAEKEQQVVGYITLLCRFVSDDIDDGPREYGYITEIFVSADQRGQGIGKALLKRAENELRKESISDLMIGVLASNTPAKAIYLAAGYKEFAITLEKKL